jgi:hypothetical protein
MPATISDNRALSASTRSTIDTSRSGTQSNPAVTTESDPRRVADQIAVAAMGTAATHRQLRPSRFPNATMQMHPAT